MSLRLLALSFTDDAANNPADVVRMRRDGQDFALLPEWQADRAVQFPVALSMTAAGSQLFVAARLSGPPNSTAQVRAVPAVPDLAASRGSTPNIQGLLGSVAPTAVVFDARGESPPVRCRLAGIPVGRLGVGVHDTTLNWQWRSSLADSWHDFARTTQRVFTLLRIPTAPWLQQPFTARNTQLPWADVLEHACRWAAGTFTPATAVAAITQAVFALGGTILRYECSGGAPTNYSAFAFDCTAFLERIVGGPGRGPQVNCTDCATIVATFANSLGCDLSQSQMFNSVFPFAVNRVRLIGQPTFSTVCNTGVFQYHEVAWEEPCTEAAAVNDACLQVLAPAPPALQISPLLPTNVQFGWPSQGTYRDLLAAPVSRDLCQPHPTLKRRRPIY